MGDRGSLTVDPHSTTWTLPLDAPAWLSPTDLRIGLGCMRLQPDVGAQPGSTEAGAANAHATVAAAVAVGVTVFDTARAYPGNEQLVASALRACGAGATARILTKGGMARPGGGWLPDGRASTIRRDCEASLAALDGLPIDCYLLHAPDPRTPFETSVRALARLAEAGLVRRIGLSNVTRAQLDRAVELAPIAAVQLGCSLLDDTALRSGLLDRCDQLGITVVAHSPLGGPRRVRRLLRDEVLTAVGDRHGVGPAAVALAWLVDGSPHRLAIPGSRRPEAVRSAVAAAGLRLDPNDRELLAARFDLQRRSSRPERRPSGATAGAPQVVLLMGIPGAGKTRAVADFVDRGYHRLNRDERGGSLREVSEALDAHLADTAAAPEHEARGVGVVLDNTYLTRTARSHVVDVATRHGLPARCVWLDTPLDQAQVNLVLRLLDRFGYLPSPGELAEHGRREPGLHTPATHLRTHRQLEPPMDDEGFASVERVPFVRDRNDAGRPRSTAVLVAAAALERDGWQAAIADAAPSAPHLLFDWQPDDVPREPPLEALGDRLRAQIDGPVELATCPHPGGPPRCWCRPPLPGLPLSFLHRHTAAPSDAVLIGTSITHRRLAAALGARLVLP